MRVSILFAAVAAGILLLPACAQPSKFAKAGVSDEARKADARECYKSVRTAMPPPLPYHGGYGVEAAIAQGIVDADRIGGYRRRLYDECMVKRGYKKLPAS